MFSCFDETFRALDRQLRNCACDFLMFGNHSNWLSVLPLDAKRRKSVTSSGRSSTSRMIRMTSG